MVTKTKPKPKTIPRLVLLEDIVTSPNHHKASHRQRLIGPATPELFAKSVPIAEKRAAFTRRMHILYLARLRAGRKPELIAKLYKVFFEVKGGTRKDFATFYHPDGEKLRIQAKLRKSSFIHGEQPRIYKSRPPIAY